MNSEDLKKLETNTQAIERLTREKEKAEAACAEMREVLERIWDHDELGFITTPESESKTSLCRECDACLPHGGHATDCITGLVSHALSSDCGKGWMSPEQFKIAVDALTLIRDYYGGAGYIGDTAAKSLAALNAPKESK